jgi:predicted RND superfamily exporter protein
MLQSQLLQNYALLLIRYRAAILLPVLVLTFVAGAYLFYSPSAGFFSELQSQLREDRRANSLHEEIGHQFDFQRPEQFIVMSCPRRVSRIDLIAMRRAVEALKNLPQVSEALWIGDVPVVNVIAVLDRSALPPDDASNSRFDAAMSDIMSNPMAVGRLISEDGKVLLVPIQMDWMEVQNDSDTLELLLNTAQVAAAQVEGNQVTFSSTGDIPLFLDQVAAYRWNKRFFLAVGIIFVIVASLLIYRNWIPVFLVSVPPTVAILWTLAIVRLTGEPDNPLVDAVLPVLIAVLGIADGIHLLSHFRNALEQGIHPDQAIANSMKHVGVACFLTSLTTAVGFGSLMLSESAMMQGFGRSCTLGVTLAFLSIMTLLPALAGTHLGRRLACSNPSDLVQRQLGLRGMWVDQWIEHRRVIGVVGILLTLGLSVSFFYLKPDEKLASRLPSRSSSYLTLKKCDESFGGIELVRVLIEWTPPTDRGKGAPEPLIGLIRQIEEKLNSEPLLQHTLSVRNLIQSISASSKKLDPLDLSVAEASVPNSLYREDLGRSIVSARLQDVGLAAYGPAFERLNRAFDELEKEYPQFEITLTGRPVYRTQEVTQVITDLGKSLVGAAIIIFAILTFVYRSLRLGIIAIVPNLLPVAATSSMLLLFGGSLDVATACALTVCLGIAVDDTIQFLTRFLSEYDKTGNVNEAVRTSYHKVGSALIITTLIMVCGFSTLLTSQLPSQRIFGTMIVCTISTALLADLVLLPALLSWFYRPQSIKPGNESSPHHGSMLT